MKRTAALINWSAIWRMFFSEVLFFALCFIAHGQSLKVDSIAYCRAIQALANGDATGRWPVKAPVPLAGALLPSHRIVAFYGNLYSHNMGILGQLPEKELLEKLQIVCKEWQAADTTRPVLPALHYIAVTAQGSGGKDGKYRLRMPDSEITKVHNMSRKAGAVMFLDIQPGHSTMIAEARQLERWLLHPDVHLGLDPEYSMKGGEVPCTAIGTVDASDINEVVRYLAALVTAYKLPPKVLVVHRFTRGMVTNYKNIVRVPQVQIVMDMDGFGSKALKLSSYNAFLYREPVQFTGFKIFYKQDSAPLYTPKEVLKLKPIPIYIQYQ
ncbi:MAG: hypothetical protein MUE71_08090 [Chitinophagaceae bacterium]|nr:hypothetical protein [Chitinophagaceae bacterium]